MRFSDLFRLSLSNLLRRKMRTFLTVLGVVIGTASIVVMVSLGLGMSRSMLQSYQSYSSLTNINVYAGGDSGMMGMRQSNTGTKAQELTDDAIDSFRMLPHVTGASPILEVYVNAKSGAASGGFSIRGVSQDYLRELKVSEDEIPKPDQDTLSLLYGNQVGYNFYKGSNYEQAIVDPMKDTIFISFPEPSGSSGSASGDGDSSAKPAKKYILPVTGVLPGGQEDYSDNSYNVYADIDTFKHFLKKIYKKDLVPNPKTNKHGKPLRYYVYDQAVVMVDDMKNVKAVSETLRNEGWQVYSNMDGLEQAQKSMNMVQAVLGGIGAVSLLVAAIGIMNTMMMSIYERTKEIGVMKVLGCDMGDIRNMFLLESGTIGLAGGVIGLILSFILSFTINFLTKNSGGGLVAMMGGGMGTGLSYIPLWLAAFAILFSIMVGTLSGYVPAVRAMKLSPLVAIRNE